MRFEDVLHQTINVFTCHFDLGIVCLLLFAFLFELNQFICLIEHCLGGQIIIGSEIGRPEQICASKGDGCSILNQLWLKHGDSYGPISRALTNLIPSIASA